MGMAAPQQTRRLDFLSAEGAAAGAAGEVAFSLALLPAALPGGRLAVNLVVAAAGAAACLVPRSLPGHWALRSRRRISNNQRHPRIRRSNCSSRTMR